jgi:hypothetical protein
MDRIRSRSLVLVLALVTVVTLLPNTASAAPCTIRVATTAAERAELWTAAIDRFAERRGLSAEQTQFLSELSRLGGEIAALKEGAPEQAAFARKATVILERGHQLFTNNELGALFTSMGTTQVWFAQLAAAPAYCNCIGTGGCTMAGGGPSGTCVTGCVSWTGDDGQDRGRVCSAN